MAFDTRYRPNRYEDVLGQESSVAVLKQFIVEGRGFHQSYVFCGQHGSGKTTLGRILARALLCEASVGGAPCDQCESCRTFLSGATHECFEELDAATKSGKSDLARIIEDLQYSTVSGKRRIYLFDECFTEDTVLLTRDGFRSIRDLVEVRFSGEVLSFDTESGQRVWRPVTDWFDLGDREVITLEFDNGVEITVTTNQEVYTTNRGWVEACRLTEDDDVEEVWFQRLVDGGRVARLIRKSEPFRAPVYDVTVEGTHSFFAASGPSPDHGILAHNCHRLSKNALDALLKPMEDSVPGSEDKRLVCIFCTTEPERMVNTIFSRCAPAFVIKSASMEAISERLAHICGQESIEYDSDALMLIAEQSGSHIRDAIKLVEGVSMLGGLTRANVSKYLHFDTNGMVLDLLESLGSDLAKAISCAAGLSSSMSPSAVYERLAEASMLLYRTHLGVVDIPMKWDRDRISRLAGKGSVWLSAASRFAAPPHRPTQHTLMLDTATAHHVYGSGVTGPVQVVVSPSSVVSGNPSPSSSESSRNPRSESSGSSESGTVKDGDGAGSVEHDSSKSTSRLTAGGVYVDARGVGRGPADRAGIESASADPNIISAALFKELVRHHIREMMGGRTRRNNVANR